MNVTIIVKDKTYKYDIVREKITKSVLTHFCYLYDELPTFREVQDKVLKELSISVNFVDYLNSINKKSILNENDAFICFNMIELFKNKDPDKYQNLSQKTDFSKKFVGQQIKHAVILSLHLF